MIFKHSVQSSQFPFGDPRRWSKVGGGNEATRLGKVENFFD